MSYASINQPFHILQAPMSQVFRHPCLWFKMKVLAVFTNSPSLPLKSISISSDISDNGGPALAPRKDSYIKYIGTTAYA